MCFRSSAPLRKSFDVGGQDTGDERQGCKLALMSVQSAKDLEVYMQAYALAMQIFEISKRFPADERYALTSQICRSSRSVCLNLREAWAKRRYEANFISKLTDCDGESNETESSLDFARDCGYLDEEEHKELLALNRSIGRMLGSMIKNPRPFILTNP